MGVTALDAGAGGAGAAALLRRHAPYAFAIADQGVLSLFNVAVAVWLLRALEPTAFGIFTIVMAAAHAAVAVQDALTSTPLGIRYATVATARRRRWLLEVLGNATYAYVLAVGAAVALATLFLASGDIGLSAAAGAFVAAFAWRSYVRSVAYARQMAGAALALDAPVLLLGLAGLAALQGTGMLRLDSALAVLAAANLLPLAPAARGPLGMPPAVAPRLLRRYRPFVGEVRWSLLGVGSVLTQRQSHTAVVPTLMSPAAYATLAAADTLMGPVRLAAVAVGMVLRPDLARRVADGDWRGIDRAMRRTLVALSGLLALVLATALAAWPLIEGGLFAGKYPEIATPFALAFAVTAVQTWRAVPNVALQVLHEFERLGRLTLVSAAVSLAATLAVTLAFGWLWALAGVLAGEALNSLLTERALRRVVAERRAART